jgi:hypothetical protein
MDYVILVVVLILGGISGFMCGCEFLFGSRNYGGGGSLSCLISASVCMTLAIGSAAWLYFASVEPTRYENVSQTTVKLVDGIAIVVKDNKLYNLNERYKRQFSEGDKVTISDIVEGPYAGLYFHESDVKMEFENAK